MTLPHEVSLTTLILQDSLINLDQLTEHKDPSIFKVDSMPLYSYEKDYNAQFDFTIQVNLDQKIISRDGYTFLDFLSDIGGIQGMLISGVAYCLAMWNYNYFDNFMVTRLYKL